MNIEIKLNHDEVQIYKRIILGDANISNEKFIQYIYDLGLAELFSQVTTRASDFIEMDRQKILTFIEVKETTSAVKKSHNNIITDMKTQTNYDNNWILDIENKITKKNWEPNNDEKEFLINAINNQEIEISDLNSLRSEDDFLKLQTEINNLQNQKSQVDITEQLENELEEMGI